MKGILLKLSIGLVAVGTVATPMVLLNQNDDSVDPIIEKQEVIQQEEPEQLNEDGCPVGFFLNYYGICQDEYLYEPQTCPDGYKWYPEMNVTKTVGTETTAGHTYNVAEVDYEATYGIDGLPKGGCGFTYETYCEDANRTDPGVTHCDGSAESLRRKKDIDTIGKCPRGFFFSLDSNSCSDDTKSYRSQYEKYVLSKHDPKDGLPKCSERTKDDKACLRDE